MNPTVRNAVCISPHKTSPTRTAADQRGGPWGPLTNKIGPDVHATALSGRRPAVLARRIDLQEGNHERPLGRFASSHPYSHQPCPRQNGVFATALSTTLPVIPGSAHCA